MPKRSSKRNRSLAMHDILIGGTIISAVSVADLMAEFIQKGEASLTILGAILSVIGAVIVSAGLIRFAFR